MKQARQGNTNIIWSPVCQKKGKGELIVMKSRMERWLGGGINGEILIKGYKLSFISSEGLVYSTLTLANNTALFTWSF